MFYNVNIIRKQLIVLRKNVYTSIPLDGLLSIYIIYFCYLCILFSNQSTKKRESLSPLASPFISIASGHYIHM